MKILVAEDNLVNLQVAMRQLSKLGYASDTARNGIEALAAHSRSSYDLVFMDCAMPGMDGFQATRLIRAGKSGNPHARIIAMTANAMHGDREQCLEAGMDDYISKPMSLKSLLVCLEETKEILGQPR